MHKVCILRRTQRRGHSFFHIVQDCIQMFLKFALIEILQKAAEAKL